MIASSLRSVIPSAAVLQASAPRQRCSDALYQISKTHLRRYKRSNSLQPLCALRRSLRHGYPGVRTPVRTMRHWQRTRAPYLPEDFDPRFLQLR